MIKYLYDKGQGTAANKSEVGQVLYNRGMLSAMLTVESIRAAQGKYGKRVVTGEEVRWGAEHLNIDNARIKALGVEGMMRAAAHLVPGPRGLALGAHPHVGRHDLELHVGLVHGRQQVAAAHDRGSRRRSTRRRRSIHAARLLEGEAERVNRVAKPHVAGRCSR